MRKATRKLALTGLFGILLSAGPALASNYIYRIPMPGLLASSTGTNTNTGSSGTGGAGVCTPGTTAFSYTGSAQSFTVPAGCTQIAVAAWGAGGGGSTTYGTGGAGAYAGATFSVVGGEQFTVIVGQAGLSGTTSPRASYGGGGSGAYSTLYGAAGGAGGGGAFLQLNGQDLLVAGGGGGGGWDDYSGSSGYGSMTGFNGQTTTGTGATTTSDTGGDGNGGGGGGGHNGGQGGIKTTNASWQFYPGGQGGMSYLDASATNQVSVAASGTTVPMTTSPGYVSGVGVAGTYSKGAGNARLVIVYQ
ncbi:hypothetical protein F6X40_35275 [Paraburkholderia sp. UCT31]|uniref:glycine-rich domain-containing protein n=1 Tax=Paraburkholderia sp. UCT31 TaxID=2615209 RepID=UPI001654DD17|nr:hypothetical protein [Paraburkholderia sp. UCT31]MBC8741812.1 hypothetical protein [Paraburkholderia sp. UCT31]